MGYYIFSFAIHTPAIQKTIGSKNEELFNKLLESETFEGYSGQDFEGHTSTKQALEDIIFGKPYNQKSAHAYWYAFIAICAHLGESLESSHEIKFGYETDLINERLKSDFGVDMAIEEVLINEKASFGLPQVQDFPMNGFLNGPDLIALKQKFEGVNITDEQLEQLQEEDDEKEMAYDSIRQTKYNVSYCLENNLDLISFCH